MKVSILLRDGKNERRPLVLGFKRMMSVRNPQSLRANDRTLFMSAILPIPSFTTFDGGLGIRSTLPSNLMQFLTKVSTSRILSVSGISFCLISLTSLAKGFLAFCCLPKSDLRKLSLTLAQSVA